MAETEDKTDNAAEAAKRGHNSLTASELRDFVHRIERREEDKQVVVDDIRAIYAEAKAKGFSPKHIRKVIKERKRSPSERDEDLAMTDLYETAAGLRRDLPLFRSVGLMAVDRTAKDSVVEALKQLVPDSGEIIVKMGGQPVRLWRDKEGEAHAEDYIEAPPPSAGGAAGVPPRQKTPIPDCSEDQAEDLGAQAARLDQPIIANPFPWDDKRRPRWDVGWRREAGSDGMGPEDE